MTGIVEMASLPPSVPMQVGAANGTVQRPEYIMFRMPLIVAYLKNVGFYCNL